MMIIQWNYTILDFKIISKGEIHMKSQKSITCLVTGASSGIGMEIAKIHAKHGGDLILVARRKKRLEELKEELETKYQIKVHVKVADLTVEEEVEGLYKKLKDKNIRVDYLVNNAGFGGHGLFADRSWQDEKRMIQLNVLALTHLTHLFLKDFIERDSGKILNVSSTASFMPGPLQNIYFSTKAFVTSFSNALSNELSHTNITVTNLMPGPTATEFAKVSNTENVKIFEGKVFSAESVAQDGYRAMLKGKMNELSAITPFQRVGLFLTKLAPKKMVMSEVRKLQEIVAKK